MLFSMQGGNKGLHVVIQDYIFYFVTPPVNFIKLTENNRAIYTKKNKTCLKWDANFPYKLHISSKVRRALAKPRLISEQP